MNRSRRIILYVYLIANIIFGILLVPMRALWGVDNYLRDVRYVPIWTTTIKSLSINGSNPVCQVDSSRLGFTLLIITIVTITMLMIFDEENGTRIVKRAKKKLKSFIEAKREINNKKETKIY